MGVLEEWVDEMVEAGDPHGELAEYRNRYGAGISIYAEMI